MLRDNTILWNSHGRFSQITYSLTNTCMSSLNLLPSMIKNVRIAPEIEENVFVQCKNLLFLKPAETQTKRITKLVSHNQLGWVFSCSQTRQKPITTQTWDHFTSQPSHDLSHPSHSHTLSKNSVLHSWNAPESPSWSFSDPGQATGTAENKPIFPLTVFRWWVHCAAL